MSTAAPFVSIGSFPWCVTDLGSGGTANFIDNLTLDQVMAFYWNIETISFTTSGTSTASSATAGGTFTTAINPASSGFFTRGFVSGGGWFTVVSGNTALASFPAINQPMDRCCLAGGQNLVVDMGMDNGDGQSQMSLELLIGTDSGNVGKYRLYYFFIFDYYKQVGSDTAEIRWCNPALSFGSFISIATGTFSISGLTFNYKCGKLTGTSSTGGTMTASSSSFTY